MKVNDDGLLLKYKEAGWDDVRIAKKMGMSIEEVRSRLVALSKAAELLAASGYDQLSVQYQIMCHQYQLLGESLKIIANALSNLPTQAEIAAVLPLASREDREAIAGKLAASFVILKPFVAVDPVKSFEEYLKAVQQGN